MYKCGFPPKVTFLVPGKVYVMAITIGDPTRPAFVTDGHLDYLDGLFASYAIDAGRASPMLCTVFRLGEQEAEAVVEFWSNTPGRRLTGP